MKFKFRQYKFRKIFTKSKSSMCLLIITLLSYWYLLHRKPPLKPEEPHIKFVSEALNYRNREVTKKKTTPILKHPKLTNLKYILLWTSPKTVPFKYFMEGQNVFIKNHCQYTNCYVTSDRSYFGDYSQFDVILFSGPEVINIEAGLPNRRSEKQKYVFASIESSHNYPLCSYKFDGYFNWTWTFRLDSESRWGYIVVRDIDNNIIGPKKEMNWLKVEDMKPLSRRFKASLLTKSKAAAWFVSDCESSSQREDYVSSLEVELELFGLSIDTYGECGMLLCPKQDQRRCNEKIRMQYYFYLAFENSFSEDYVTEKIVLGLQNIAIPIVYGGANYTRFIPEGIYLNARELGPKKLAEKMNYLIKNPTEYAKYFKWLNHYKFQLKSKSEETNDYCDMCKLLNNNEMMEKKSVHEKFRQWWDSPNFCLVRFGPDILEKS